MRLGGANQGVQPKEPNDTDSRLRLRRRDQPEHLKDCLAVPNFYQFVSLGMVSAHTHGDVVESGSQACRKLSEHVCLQRNVSKSALVWWHLRGYVALARPIPMQDHCRILDRIVCGICEDSTRELACRNDIADDPFWMGFVILLRCSGQQKKADKDQC